MMANEERITWITPEYFLDTDIHVIKHLAPFYRIAWYIVHSGTQELDFKTEIDSLKDCGVSVKIYQLYPRGMDPGNLTRFKCLAKSIRDSGSRFVYTSLAYPFYFLPVMAHYIGTDRMVLAVHNAHIPKGGSFYYRNKLYNTYAIRKFKHFQVFSESQYQYIKEKSGGKEVRLIPFFLKDYGKPETPVEKGDCVTFLNYGHIRDYKRIDVLISAAQKAYRATGIKFKVIIAGTCPDWEKYRKLITDELLFDLRIRFIREEEIPSLFAEADYFVLPYQDIAQSGSAIVALNYDIPLIASRLPAFEEYIEDRKTGFLFKPADQKELEEIMKYILQNHERIYPEMKENLKGEKEAIFNEEKIVHSYREYIKSVINQ